MALSRCPNKLECVLLQASRSGKNVIRDSRGCVHLGRTKTVKRLFARGGAGAERYVKSKQTKVSVKTNSITCLMGTFVLSILERLSSYTYRRCIECLLV